MATLPDLVSAGVLLYTDIFRTGTMSTEADFVSIRCGAQVGSRSYKWIRVDKSNNKSNFEPQSGGHNQLIR